MLYQPGQYIYITEQEWTRFIFDESISDQEWLERVVLHHELTGCRVGRLIDAWEVIPFNDDGDDTCEMVRQSQFFM